MRTSLITRPPKPPVTVRVFTQRFSSTRLGARLARHLAVHRLDAWGFPYGTSFSDDVGAVVGELVANAVTHGRVPGRDFELRLAVVGGLARTGTLRIDVTDTRTERRPPSPGGLAPAPPDADAGRGLLVVAALATRWTVLDRLPVGKTVRAELDLAPGVTPGGSASGRPTPSCP
ncbi:ATP-binding protein [Streptomyces albofaciens JCM 4342]|uniref:ATP-binding protein n=1 Tax=Streptomyces albofaciens TaxID=66866 RepID=UPI00123C091F|nr:ATP-binding protein [Streptomyces albofaciens]KAA6222289.1 ATP-binding protein [Streptomyces albofaciens JCM 4342]